MFIGDILTLVVDVIPKETANQGFSLIVWDPLVLGFTGIPLEVEGLIAGSTWVDVYSDDGNYHSECSITVNEHD